MIRHILKIIQAQFRNNLWILAELMVVFVALWIMTDYFITQYTLYHRPVGFDTDRVYQVTVSKRSVDAPQFIVYPENSEEPRQNFDRIVERIRQHPDVEAVALSMFSLPYTHSNTTYGFRRDSVELWNIRRQAVLRMNWRNDLFNRDWLSRQTWLKPFSVGPMSWVKS